MATCKTCGAEGIMDSKPKRFAGAPVTHAQLAAAAYAGETFDHEECAACYGPAFLPDDSEPAAEEIRAQPHPPIKTAD